MIGLFVLLSIASALVFLGLEKGEKYETKRLIVGKELHDVVPAINLAVTVGKKIVRDAAQPIIGPGIGYTQERAVQYLMEMGEAALKDYERQHPEAVRHLVGDETDIKHSAVEYGHADKVLDEMYSHMRFVLEERGIKFKK